MLICSCEAKSVSPTQSNISLSLSLSLSCFFNLQKFSQTHLVFPSVLLLFRPFVFHLLVHTFMFVYIRICRACSKDRLEVVQCLLSRSSNEPLPNLSGSESPIHIVCQRGNHKIAQVLLDHSPRLVYASHGEGETPLHMACSKRDLDMVRVICSCIRSYVASTRIKEGEVLPPDMKDKAGCTPFFIACFHGHIEIVRELCQLKEDLGQNMTLNVNSPQSDTNRTPLHVAVSNGSLDTVKVLLSLEDTDRNPEARPAPTTHEMLLRNVEMKRHGRLLLSLELDELSLPRVGDNLSSSPTETSLNTPRFSTMIPGGNYGGGASAAASNTGYSSYTQGDTSTSYAPNAPNQTSTTLSNFTAPAQRKSPSPKNPRRQSQTAMAATTIREESLEGEEGADDRVLAIFLNQREELVVGKRDRTGGTMFGQLKLTPLAEACALGHTEIAEELLSYGGHDSTGLACRIASLAQEYDLMQHMLSRCCTVVRRERPNQGSSSTGERGVQIEPGLKLSWSSKKLPELKGEWFLDGAVYYVDPPHNPERDAEQERMSQSERNLRRINPPKLRRLTPADMPIRELNLARNNLRSLPLEVFQLEHLCDLQLQQNRIVQLPEAEGKPWLCPRLEHVNLGHNNILRVPACLWRLPNLRKICISQNNISTFAESDIPVQGDLSPLLTSLDLSHNCIGPSLPPFFFEFPSLEKAWFSKNKLAQLPDTLWSCRTLQELTVSSNLLTSLPLCDPTPEGLSPEDSLAVGHTILRQSDVILTGVVQVKPKSGNTSAKPKSSLYRTIKPSGGELSWVNYCVVNTESYDYSQLKKLDLSRNKLSRFPEALPCLAPNLTELVLSHNPVGSVDVQLVPESVKKLVCKSCGIETVGSVIGPEEYTQVVRLCRCQVDPYRGSACQHRNHPRLNHLTSFDLSHNKLQHFQLIQRHLQAQRFGKDPGNQPIEKEFQPSLSSLELLYPALENLDLAHNDLRGLFNPNIGHQTHLKSIKLSSNPELERIPYEFSCLKKSKDFTELAMSDLPKLHEPPAEYQTAELSHVLTYMRSCLKE